MEAAGAWCAEATSAASRLRTPLPLVDGAFFSPGFLMQSSKISCLLIPVSISSLINKQPATWTRPTINLRWP